MLVVRDRTIERMAAVHLDGYRARLLDHLAGCFPAQVRALGEDRVRAIADRAIAVTDPLGFTTGAEVARYVGLSLVVGGDLLEPPHRGWAAPVLGDPALTAEQKLGRLAVLARRRGHRFGGEGAP